MPTEQQQINYGNTANDGQGDPLRTAFIKTDDNFDAIWAAGPVGSNIVITNNLAQVTNTNGNIAIAANGIGVIETRSSILPRLANSYDLGSSNLRFRSAYIGSGGLSVLGNLTVTGNYTIGDLRVNSISSDDSTLVTVQDGLSVRGLIDTDSIYTDNYFYANGAPFSPGGDYGNANVADFLTSYTGNISANNAVITDRLDPAAENTGSIGRPTRVWNSIWVNNIQSNVTVTGNVVTSSITNEFPVEITSNNFTWQFAGNILRSPEGGSWTSSADTAYFNSPANGFVNISSLQNDNVVSELFMEHNFIRFQVDNGGPPQTWQMNLDGLFSVPGDIIPQSNGTASLGNSTNYWSNLWVANNTIYIGGVPLGVTGNTLTVNGEAVLSNDSDSSITTTGNISAGNISVTGDITANNYVYFRGGSIIGDETDGNIFRVIAPLTYGVSIETDADIEGNNWNWTFNADGTLDTPGAVNVTGNLEANKLFVSNFADIGDISIAGGYIVLVDGSASTGIDISPNAEGQAFLQVPNDATANTANLRVVNNAGNVRVETNAGNIWTFGYNGDLTAPGNVSADAILTDNYRYANGEPFVSSSTGNITFVNTTISSPDGDDLFITAANAEVEITGEDFRVEVTDDVRIQGNDIVSIRNTSSVDSITIRTDYNGNDYVWEFDATGNLITPGNIEVSGDITVAGHITGTSSASTLVLAAEPSSNTAIQLNDTVDSIIRTVANLEIRTNVSDTVKTWTFDTTGNLTAPGNITGTNLIVSESLIGADASPQPTISGFSTISATGNITGANLITTGNVVGNVSGFAIGYRDIPQVSFTGNATMAAADAGKHFYSTESTDYVLTIADNSAVSWPVGTAVTIVNRGTGNITVAQAAGVSLYLAGNSTAGNRTVSTYGMATVLNVAANVWMINGTGVV